MPTSSISRLLSKVLGIVNGGVVIMGVGEGCGLMGKDGHCFFGWQGGWWCVSSNLNPPFCRDGDKLSLSLIILT